MLSDLVRGFVQLAYPAVCLRCEALLGPAETDFCAACVRALTDDAHFACPRCASTVGEHADVASGCSRCRGEAFSFDFATRLGPYEGALREGILAMKHAAGQPLAEGLGRLWANHHADRFRVLSAPVLIPVPLHWWRRWRRGYNQAESLSGAVARVLGAEHRPGWLRRIRPTASQVQVSPTERRANLRGAFRLGPGAKLGGRSVWLIDDVLTTGSTASEAARVLRQAGAVRVNVAVLAHR